MQSQSKLSVEPQYLCDVMEQWGTPSKAVVDTCVSTGIVSLDAALGGKLPSGVIEIFGEAATGKSTLLYEILGTAQKSGVPVALCPSEYVDKPYMKRLGLDLEDLVLLTGKYGEDVLSAALEYLSGAALVAVDSLTSLRPKNDTAGSWLKMVWEFLEVAQRDLKPGAGIVLINQVRCRRSLDPKQFFVEKVVDSYARKVIDVFSVRMETSRGETRAGQKEIVVNIHSNIASKPAVVLALPLGNYGVDTMRDLLNFSLELKAVRQEGTWFWFEDIRLGKGVKEAAEFLAENELVCRSILDQVMVKA